MSQRLKKLEEVKALQAKIEQLKNEAASAEAADKESAILECTEVARRWGFSIHELFGQKASDTTYKVARKKAAAKFQHPEDASKTWAGQGRAPRWITDHEAAGGSRDDLLINKD